MSTLGASQGFVLPSPAHDEAIYFLAHRREYGLSLAERHDLMQVVAYTMGGSRDEAAVRNCLGPRALQSKEPEAGIARALRWAGECRHQLGLRPWGQSRATLLGRLCP